MKFNAPPTWPQPPAGWTPPPGWSPAPDWPSAPEGWQYWVEDEPAASAPESGAPHRSQSSPIQRLTSSIAERSRRAATASSGLWRRASASPQRHWVFGGAGVGVGLLGGVLLATAATAPQSPASSGSGSSWFGSGPTAIETAVEDCGLTDSAGVSVGDDGLSVTLQTTGADNSYGAEVAELSCVLYGLDVSDSVVSRMDSTRALDGRQTGTWDIFDASWGYHPDDGVNVVIEEVE